MAHIVTGNVATPGMDLANGDSFMQLASGLTALAGDCLSVDMTKVKDTTGGDFRFYEVRAPVTADFLSASTAANAQPYMCIALADQSTAAGLVKVRFQGGVDALVEDSGQAIGAKLSPKNASRVLDTAATAAGTGTRLVAILRQATTAANQIVRVEFDGVSGVLGVPMITN